MAAMNESEEISMELSKMCRVCANSAEGGIKIFGNQEIWKKLKMHLPIPIFKNDGMSPNLCMNCKEKLDVVHDLVYSSLKTDLQLRKYSRIEGILLYEVKYKELVDTCLAEIQQEIPQQNNLLTQVVVKLETNLPNKNLMESDQGTYPASATQIKVAHCCINCETTFENLDLYKNHESRCSKRNITPVESPESEKIIVVDEPIMKRKMEEDENELTSHKKIKNGKVPNKKHNKLAHIKNGNFVLANLREIPSPKKNTYLKIVPESVKKMNYSSYMCFGCYRTFDTYCYLMSHKRLCKNNENEDESDYENHISWMNAQIHEKLDKKTLDHGVQCGFCERLFDSQPDLQFHAKEQHEDDLLYMCNVCGEKCEAWSVYYSEHVQAHKPKAPFLCDICGKNFKRKKNLMIHQKAHLAEPHKKKLHCEECGKGFQKEFNFTEHMNFHTGNMPYSCEDCEKTFHTLDNLKKHTPVHGPKEHLCSICGATFSRRGNMLQHAASHDNEGFFTCSLCKEKFTSMKALIHHRKQHTDEDMMMQSKQQCEFCHKFFTRISNYRRHLRIHLNSDNNVNSPKVEEHVVYESGDFEEGVDVQESSL